MHVLIGIAIKSLFVAGLTLGLVQLMGKRSAAERSWVAHIGLLALVIMAFAPLVLPSWNVAMPGLFGRAVEPSSIAEMAPVAVTTPVPAASITHHIAKVSPLSSVTPATVATAVYAVPAAILLIITLLALAHLVALRARADVLVDGHWLSALARAQRRMGFKHGTALLTSDDLASPISWGLMRPVILLNSRAVEATGEAEAIIAHELAHVARMDWIKLLLARIATALFWFNPLVWMLAREAHQLREEAADDSVLAADIVDTDYAQLLVGVARHECPGLLLGAHGVAPSRSSLGRRVARVLDGASVRGPVARPFALGAFTGAVLIAAPLAALTLTPGGPRLAKPAPALTAKAGSRGTGYADAREVPADLPHIIARGVSTSVSTAVAAISQANDAETQAEAAADRADAARDAALEQAAAARDAAIERAQAIAENAREQARRYGGKDYALREAGVTPEYAAGIRSAAPQLARNRDDEFVPMKAVGVTPVYVQDLANAGLRNLTVDQLVEVRAVGLTGDYVRAVVAAGVRPILEDLVQFRTIGITPEKIARARQAGARTNDEIMRMAVTDGFNRRGWPFEGARSPAPVTPRVGKPAASPPNWDNDPGDG